VDGEVVSKDCKLTFTVVEDVTYVANFKLTTQVVAEKWFDHWFDKPEVEPKPPVAPKPPAKPQNPIANMIGGLIKLSLDFWF